MITIKVEQAVKLQNEYSMFISFPYDNRILDVIRSFPSSTRFWHSVSKEWEMSLLNMDKLLAKLPEQEFDITAPNIEITKPDAEVPKGFEFKTKPFEHQIAGFNFGLANDRWFLGDEQGLGKTKQVIDIAIAKRLQRGYKHCLIICGVNGLKWNWQNEIKTHSNESGYILGQRGNKIGSNKDKLDDVLNLADIPDYFVITNVETLRDDNIARELQKLCINKIIGITAIDEIHKCFDYNTLITTNIGNLKIGDIVKNKIDCSVLSYNEITGEKEWKQIVNWYENVIAEPLLELQFETKDGIKIIKCTKGHKFFTKNRGWVKAEDLTDYDDIKEF